MEIVRDIKGLVYRHLLRMSSRRVRRVSGSLEGSAGSHPLVTISQVHQRGKGRDSLEAILGANIDCMEALKTDGQRRELWGRTHKHIRRLPSPEVTQSRAIGARDSPAGSTPRT